MSTDVHTSYLPRGVAGPMHAAAKVPLANRKAPRRDAYLGCKLHTKAARSPVDASNKRGSAASRACCCSRHWLPGAGPMASLVPSPDDWR